MSASRRPPIVTVAAAKGGVGKTTLAYELAAGLDGVLVDLDWDAGGATRMWGFDPAKAARAPLLDGFERGPDGRPPRPKRRANQPALVPAHPDLSARPASRSTKRRGGTGGTIVGTSRMR